MKKKMKQQAKQHSPKEHNTHVFKRLHTTNWAVFHGDVTHRKEVEGRLHKEWVTQTQCNSSQLRWSSVHNLHVLMVHGGLLWLWQERVCIGLLPSFADWPLQCFPLCQKLQLHLKFAL